MRKYKSQVAAALFVIAFYVSMALVASAQTPITGMDIVDLGRSASAITPSDSTVFTPTRFVYIAGTGAGAACNAVVLFNGDSSTVSLAFLQPGRFYRMSITQMLSTGTTCAGSVAVR